MNSMRLDHDRCVIEHLEVRSLFSTVSFPGDLAIDGRGSCYVSTLSQRVDTDSSGVVDNWGNSILRVVKYSPAGKSAWSYSVDLGTTSGAGRAIAVDGAGNVYLAGQFARQVDFEPGPRTTALTSLGNNDVFLLKLSPAGTVSWVQQVGGKGDDRARDVTLGNDGNIYVSGSFSGVAQAGARAGSRRLTSAGGSDAFIAGFSPKGKSVSAYRFGGRGNDQANSVAFTSTGNMLVGGGFQGSMSFGGAVPPLRSAGQQDGWVARISAAGKVVSARQIGGKGYENVQKVSVGPGGDIWLGGEFEGDTDLEGSDDADVSGQDGAGGAFVGRYDQNLNPRWVGVVGESSQSAGVMTVDAAGNTYLTTEHSGSAGIWSLGPKLAPPKGSAGILIAKLDASGKLNWIRPVGSNQYDDAWAIASGPTNGIWILGGNVDSDTTNIAGSRAAVNQFSGTGKSLSQWYVGD